MVQNKICVQKKILCLKKFSVLKNLGPKKIWSNKNFRSEQKFGLKKIVGPKDILSPKKFWILKIFFSSFYTMHIVLAMIPNLFKHSNWKEHFTILCVLFVHLLVTRILYIPICAFSNMHFHKIICTNQFVQNNLQEEILTNQFAENNEH